MLKIALVGNIASGKSLVSSFLKKNGIKVLSLDEVVHFLYDFDVELQKFLLDEFNSTKRADIAKIVFQDNEKKHKLEQFIFPKITEKMNLFFMDNKSQKFVVVEAPMLFEYKMESYFDKIIFVSSDENIRLERLIKRNNFDRKTAELRISSQISEKFKIKKADYLIYNNSTKDDLEFECKKLITKLNTL